MTTETHPAVSDAMREAEALVDGICAKLGYGTRLVSLRWAVASEIARLTGERDAARADAFSLAANQCEGPMYGDEHGNSYCPKVQAAEAETARLRAEIAKLST